MKKIQAGRTHPLKQFLACLFIQSSKTPQSFQLFLLTTQALFFALFIISDGPNSSSSLRNNLTTFPSIVIIDNILQLNLQSLFLIVGIKNLLLRYISTKNAIKGFYLFAIICAQTSNKVNTGIYAGIWIITCLNLIIEILSTYECEFVSGNFYSETMNSLKFLHYIVIIASALLRIKEDQIFSEKWISHTIILGIFSLLFLLKCLSHCKKVLNKEFHLRFYFLVMIFSVSNIIENWGVGIEPLYKVTLIITVSQISITILLKKLNKIKIENLLGEKNKQNICFMLLSYRNQFEKNRQLQKVIDKLIGKMPPKFVLPEEIDFKFQSKDRKAYLLGEKIIELLKEENDFLAVFLKLQIRFNIIKQPLQAKKQIVGLKQSIQEKTTLINFPFKLFQKLILYKFQKRFNSLIVNQYKVNQYTCFDEMFENQILRNLLVRATLSYASLWEAFSFTVNKQELILKSISKKIDKILEKQTEIQIKFKETKIISKDIMLGYIDYMFMVERNVEKANNYSRNFWIFPELHNYLKLDEIVYICIGIDPDNFLQVTNTSYNIKKLLGYDKNFLKGQKISILMPEFYKQIHETTISSKILNSNKQYFFNFHKQSIIKHQEGYYLPMKVHLKVVFDPVNQKLYLEGFIKLLSANNYDWTNFFFTASSNDKIIEVGNYLSSHYGIMKNATEFLHTEIFKNQSIKNNTLEQNPFFFYSKTARKEEDQLSYCQQTHKTKFFSEGNTHFQYHLLLEIKLDDSKVADFYVAKRSSANDNYSDNSSKQAIQDQLIDFESQSSQLITEKYYNKYCLFFEDFELNLPTYFSTTEQILQKTKSKSLCVNLAAVILILLVMFGVQGFLIEEFKLDQQASIGYMHDFQYIKNQTFAIDQIFTYGLLIEIKIKYGYPSNLTGVNPLFEELSLQLQETAEQLKNYNTEFYEPYQNDLSVSARIQDLPKSAKILIKQVGANPFVSLYLQEYSVLLNNLKQMHILINKVYSGLAQSYILNYCVFLQKSQNFQQTEVFISLLLLILLPFILTFLVLRSINHLNQIQLQAIHALIETNSSSMFLSYINNFLNKFVGGATRLSSKITEQTQQRAEKEEKQRKICIQSKNLSGSASYRQNSVRNLADEINSTNRETMNWQKNDEQENETQDEAKERKGKRVLIKKRTVIFLIFHSLMLSANSVIFLSQAPLRKQSIFGYSSVYLTNILLKQSYFSQTIITFMSDVLGQADEGIFEKSLQKFQSIENQPDDQFFQLGLQTFSEFAQKISDLKHKNVCEYNLCEQNLYSSMNLVYGTLIQKMNSYMVSNRNILQITTATLEFQTLISSNFITQKITNNVLSAYIQEFGSNSVFLFDLVSMYNYLNILMIAITVLLYIGGILIIWVKKKQNKIRKIINLIPRESFQENKNQQAKALVKSSSQKVSKLVKKSSLIIQNV